MDIFQFIQSINKVAIIVFFLTGFSLIFEIYLFIKKGRENKKKPKISSLTTSGASHFQKKLTIALREEKQPLSKQPNMKIKINISTIILIGIISIFAALSFFIVSKLQEKKPITPTSPPKSIAETTVDQRPIVGEQPMNKLTVLPSPTPSPTVTPQMGITIVQTIPSPTQIQLQTTPPSRKVFTNSATATIPSSSVQQQSTPTPISKIIAQAEATITPIPTKKKSTTQSTPTSTIKQSDTKNTLIPTSKIIAQAGEKVTSLPVAGMYEIPFFMIGAALFLIIVSFIL